MEGFTGPKLEPPREQHLFVELRERSAAHLMVAIRVGNIRKEVGPTRSARNVSRIVLKQTGWRDVFYSSSRTPVTGRGGLVEKGGRDTEYAMAAEDSEKSTFT